MNRVYKPESSAFLPECWGHQSLSVVTLRRPLHVSAFKTQALPGVPWWSSGRHSSFYCCGPGSIPGRGTKIPQAACQGQNNNNQKETKPQALRTPCSPAWCGGPHKLSPPPSAASGRTLAWGNRARIRSEQLSKSSGESTSCWAP